MRTWLLLRLPPLLLLAAILPACGGGSGSGKKGTPPTPPPPGPNVGFGSYGIAYSWIDGLALAVATDGTHQFTAGMDYSIFSYYPSWRVEKRLLSDGSLVSGFGVGGAVKTPVPATLGWLAARPSCMVLVGSVMFIGGFGQINIAGDVGWRLECRSVTDGSLVSGFGTNGVMLLDLGAGDEELLAMAADATAIYLVGSRGPHATREWYIEKRLQSDGSLVSGFGTGGALAADPSPGDDSPMAAVIDGTDLLIGGFDEGGAGPGDYRWRIERRTLDKGELVAGFGSGGVVLTDIVGSSDQVRSLLIHNGALYAGGTDSAPGDAEWRVEKRDPVTGALDNAFGTLGVFQSNPSPREDVIIRLAAEAGFLYATGYDFARGVGEEEWRLERRDALTGAPDNTFGTAGAVSNGLRGAWCQPQGLIATPTAIYVTGFEQEPTTTGRRDWRYEKRSAVDGSLVAGYGLDSHIVVPAHYSSVVSLAIAGDALIAAGIDEYSAPDSRWRVEKRFLSNGQLDPDFGNQGEVLSDPSSDRDAVKAMTVVGNAIFIVGASFATTPTVAEWRLEKRRLSDGALLKTEVSILPGGGVPQALVSDGSYLYIVGVEQAPDDHWRIEKRRVSDCGLVAGFGSGGAVVSDPTSEHDGATAVALANGVLYIAGYSWGGAAANFQWRIEKRLALDGSLIHNFGSSGVVTSNPGGYDDQPTSILVDGSSLFIAGNGTDNSGSYRLWRVEKRHASSGGLVPAFGTDGVVQLPSPDGDAKVMGALLVDGHLYLTGYDHPGPMSHWRTERRDPVTGDLDTSFGNSGVAPSPSPNGLTGAAAFTVGVDGDWVYVGGTASTGYSAAWWIDRYPR